MKYCNKCGACSPVVYRRCVHCHADLAVLVGTTLLTIASVIWGV